MMTNINFRRVHLDPQYFNLKTFCLSHINLWLYFFNLHYINKTDPKTVKLGRTQLEIVSQSYNWVVYELLHFTKWKYGLATQSIYCQWSSTSTNPSFQFTNYATFYMEPQLNNPSTSSTTVLLNQVKPFKGWGPFCLGFAICCNVCL